MKNLVSLLSIEIGDQSSRPEYINRVRIDPIILAV